MYKSFFKNDKLTWYWWYFMLIGSIINLKLISDFYFNNRLNDFQMKITQLAFIYTIVGALRAYYPKKDLERVCFFDSILSYPFFGRTIATVAEISYIQLIVLIIKKIVVDNFEKNSNILLTLDMLVPIIIFAQVMCWAGCLTKNSLWNTIEESIWAFVSLALFIINYIIYSDSKNLPQSNKIQDVQQLSFIFMTGTLIFFIFMVTVDIPMYFRKWKNNQKNSLFEMTQDMMQCKKTSTKLKYWKEEIPWKTGYFVFGVLSSILLVKWYYNYSSYRV